MNDPTFVANYANELNAFLCLSGLALHISIKWEKHRREVAKIGLLAYVAELPAQTAVAIIGTVVAFVGTFALGWMNPGMAIACGYMGNSIAENMASKFAATAK